MKSIYLKALEPCVRRPVVVVSAAVLALLGALAFVPSIGTEFLPPLEEGAVLTSIARLPKFQKPLYSRCRHFDGRARR